MAETSLSQHLVFYDSLRTQPPLGNREMKLLGNTYAVILNVFVVSEWYRDRRELKTSAVGARPLCWPVIGE